MIINSKWWENPENIAIMVRFQCTQAMAAMPDGGFGDCTAVGEKIVEIAQAVSDPEEFHGVFVSAVLAGLDLVICRCGACGGREWNAGAKLHAHFVELLENGRSLNFSEPQEEEAV